MVCDKKLDKTAQRNAIMQHMHFIVPMWSFLNLQTQICRTEVGTQAEQTKLSFHIAFGTVNDWMTNYPVSWNSRPWEMAMLNTSNYAMSPRCWAFVRKTHTFFWMRNTQAKAGAAVSGGNMEERHGMKRREAAKHSLRKVKRHHGIKNESTERQKLGCHRVPWRLFFTPTAHPKPLHQVLRAAKETCEVVIPVWEEPEKTHSDIQPEATTKQNAEKRSSTKKTHWKEKRLENTYSIHLHIQLPQVVNQSSKVKLRGPSHGTWKAISSIEVGRRARLKVCQNDILYFDAFVSRPQVVMYLWCIEDMSAICCLNVGAIQTTLESNQPGREFIRLKSESLRL